MGVLSVTPGLMIENGLSVALVVQLAEVEQ